MPSLLVLGTSDSDGSHLDRREDTWPWLLAAALAAPGEPGPTVHKRFYATAPGALDYLERQLEATEPDIIVLSLTLYAFSVRTVANRIRRVAGARAGAWAERQFNRFDRATGPTAAGMSGRPAWGHALNRAAHRAARTVIGTASEASPREVLRAYTTAIERLAREEDVRVVVVGSFPFTVEIERENPRVRDVQRVFNQCIARLCRERRIGWVDPEFMRDRDVDALYTDALHFTEAAHRRVAAEVSAVLSNS